jgi:hypothetical protein
MRAGRQDVIPLRLPALGGCRDRQPAFAIHAKNTELEAIPAECVRRHGSRNVDLTREYSHDSSEDRKRLQDILRRISDNVHRSPVHLEESRRR